MSELNGQSTDPNVPGVLGENTHGEGVRGVSHSQHGGVVGVNVSEASFTAPKGQGNALDNPHGGAGVWGESDRGEGVHGVSHSQHGGVVGVNVSVTSDTAPKGKRSVLDKNPIGGAGVWGESDRGEGVKGISHSKDYGAVVGLNDGGNVGVYGESKINGDGVVGHGTGTGRGVVGVSDHATGVEGNSTTGAGVYGKSTSGAAGYFEGNVVVTDEVQIAGTNILAVVNFITQARISIERVQVSLEYAITGTHFTPGGEVDVSFGDRYFPAGYDSFTVLTNSNGYFSHVTKHDPDKRGHGVVLEGEVSFFEAKDVASGVSIKGSILNNLSPSSWSWRSSES